MHVRNVGMPLTVPVPFVFMKELTQEINHIIVRNVENALVNPVLFIRIKEFTKEKNPINVSSVREPFVIHCC